MANLQPSSSNVEPQTQSAFPLPVMEYVNQYTNEAVKRGTAPKPPPPITESYQMFGQTCHEDDAIIRPLETQNLPRLYPEVFDKREELKKLSTSILCNFLDLLDILAKCGVSPGRDEKIEDLNILFINMHHIINEFRPHQARETLKVMMEMRKKNLSETGENVCKTMSKISDMLKQCSEDLALLKSQNPILSTDVSTQWLSDMMETDLPASPSGGDNLATIKDSKQDLTVEEKDRMMIEMMENLPE